MSSTIPPFLCSTPPPIDFDETNDNDEDFSTYEANDTEFGSLNDITVESNSPQKNKKLNETSELPLPQDTNFPFYLNQNSISSDDLKENSESKIDECENKTRNSSDISEIEKVNDIKIITDDSLEKSEQNIVNDDINKISKTGENYDDFETDPIDHITDNIENYLNIDSSLEKNREGSPQSLEFGISHLSEDDSSIGEFQNVKINYDDNTSLPSLKFDPVGNVKSDTPISEEDTKCKVDELNNKSELLDDDALIMSAFQSENVNDEKSCKNNIELKTEKLNYEKIDDQNQNIVSDTTVEVFIDKSVKKSCDDDNDNNDFDSDEFDAFESFTCDRTTLQSNNINIVTQEFPDQQVFNSSTDVTFEADFSQFEAFNNNESDNLSSQQDETIKIEENKNLIDEGIKNINDLSSQISNNKIEDNFENDHKDENEEFDDDFGEFNEFNEFKESKPADEKQDVTITSSSINVYDKLNSVINMMFPNDENSELSTEIDKIYQRNDFNKLETNLNDIDSAKALDYQWINSNVKHSLIKSLGIDSRNILYGEKWSSNVPRFAANLGFCPLEPLKPIKINENQSTTSKNSENKSRMNKSDVPAVDFDWNSSGLVNPLDGVKEILHERKMDTIHTSQSNSNNQSIKNNDQQENEISTKNNEKSTDTITSISDINNDITIINSSVLEQSSYTIDDTNNYRKENHNKKNNLIEEIEQRKQQQHQHQQQEDQEQHKVLSTSYTLPLKETHIFTPDNNNKNKNNSIDKLDNKNKGILINNKETNTEINIDCTVDFDYKMAAAGIIINENVVKKEYRDIEYNPIELKTDLNIPKDTIIYNNNNDNDDNDDKINYETSHNTTEYYKNRKCDLKDFTDNNINSKKLSKSNSNELFDFKNESKSQIAINSNNTNNNSVNIISNSSNVFCDFETNIFNEDKILCHQSNISIENTFDSTILPSGNEKINLNNENTTKILTDDDDKKYDKKKEIEDEFTDFQCASPLPSIQKEKKISKTITTPEKQINLSNSNQKSQIQNELYQIPKGSDEMILSPAVLLPKSIEIEKQNEPQINWPEPGINYEELERLEKMFPQSKNVSPENKSSHSSSFNTTNINMNAGGGNDNDDDDWSDFISVTVPIENKQSSSPKHIAQFQQTTIPTTNIGSTYDDEWSDFVYSTPPPPSSSSLSQQYLLGSSSISCVSDSFSGLMNATNLTKSWQQHQLQPASLNNRNNLIPDQQSNQFLQMTTTTTTTVPISSQCYQGNNILNTNNNNNNKNENYSGNLTQQQQQQQSYQYQQNFLNGFTMPTKSVSNHQMPSLNRNQNFSQVNNIFSNNSISVQQHHQQQQQKLQHRQQLHQQQYLHLNKNPFINKNSNLSSIPDLGFVTPKNYITNSSNNKLNNTKK